DCYACEGVVSQRNRRSIMSSATTELSEKHCKPCEGGVPALAPDQVRKMLGAVPGWQLAEDGQRLRREWRVKEFMARRGFFERLAKLAEEEGHHPDLHLTGYRNVAVELWTHAVGGLTENDFILAAKIDKLPVEVRPAKG